MPENKRKILVIVGPTAIGKTNLAVSVARTINAEIISADSRQIFRHMDICTAKPAVAERDSIPHHFIDHIDPDQYYNAGQYGADGRAVVEQIWARNKEVVVVGGSGLYIRSLIDGFIGEGEKSEPVRLEIRDRIAQLGLKSVYHELEIVDPAAASKIHPNDAKRIERALEVFEFTGKRISEKHAEKTVEINFTPVMIGLTCDRAELYRRINMRVEDMIRRGVIEETKQLIEKGYSPQLTSMESLGYREIVAHLRGDITYERMLVLFKQGSRNYAKRQLTWFRRDKRVRWFDVTKYTSGELVDAVIVSLQTSENH
ncbi:tRNA (adenosine(37)-N6)-dimethylallyltransferase MiaA [bacterium]|nr:tRNA (adenosine(37)-N6)-dimethylallyltransferase MiaA [bacterium]